MADPLTDTIERRRDVVHRQVEGEMIIVLPHSNEVIVLNETGAAVWELTDGTRTGAQVAEEVAARFGAPLSTVRDDVAALYHELIEAQALNPVP